MCFLAQQKETTGPVSYSKTSRGNKFNRREDERKAEVISICLSTQAMINIEQLSKETKWKLFSLFSETEFVFNIFYLNIKNSYFANIKLFS